MASANKGAPTTDRQLVVGAPFAIEITEVDLI